MCVCVREREREQGQREKLYVSVCVCVRERERERKCVCTCACQRWESICGEEWSLSTKTIHQIGETKQQGGMTHRSAQQHPFFLETDWPREVTELMATMSLLGSFHDMFLSSIFFLNSLVRLTMASSTL